ncbi:PilZ domain-containing protein [Agrobacterium vitis]|uniref:PilZ domain-containing protein n=1 Tax=Rhizobium/Agrobacterium group TaxID=227290 RepID=UPI0012E8A68F|nr:MULTISPECIES: PilZ domain-containing protein [Rhizobium/Agrobacterium group]MCF1471574.1 PilZ domain-containing protein [Allorhizobium ampelinum]MVA51486.1 PilZ domain-containing protein [Agrobacterium vitis]NSZ52870.1 PilZ domain-containing protein [Agrobacterium vitis]NTA31629.1 PilZ domain-containing protein [Agrobacterium vitis]
MYSYNQAPNSGSARPPVQRAFQRVSVSLEGRLMVPSEDEYVCLTVDMSPGDVRVICAARPMPGERIIAYIDHIGRIEGTVIKNTDDGFVISIVATERKREKLAAQLTWIANKHELGLPEDRRHDRLTPKQPRTELVFDDGRKYSCRIMDLSLSGAAIDIDIRPPLGTAVRLGSMRGRVVRHFLEGVAIEFTTLQSREALTEFL